MDEWGFESGEELKVFEKKSGKRSSLPRFALPALLIAAGLLVVLALLWSAPLARETTAFRNRTAQDGLTYSYTIDQGVATACGVLAVGLAVAGYALYAIVAAADGVVTSMLLRRDLRRLR